MTSHNLSIQLVDVSCGIGAAEWSAFVPDVDHSGEAKLLEGIGERFLLETRAMGWLLFLKDSSHSLGRRDFASIAEALDLCRDFGLPIWWLDGEKREWIAVEKRGDDE